MSPLSRRITLSWAMALALAPVAASPQTIERSPELRRVASRMTDALPSATPVRLAVIPLADGEMPTAIRVASDLTERLRSALESIVRVYRRTIEIIETPVIDRAAWELQIAQPLGVDGSILVGVLIDADYVVLGSVSRRPDGTPGRLSVQLLEVATRRQYQTANVDLESHALDAAATGVEAAAVPASAPAPPAAVTQPVAGADSPPPATGGVSGRQLLLSTGFIGAAAASLVAVSKERELRLSRDRLLELPAGAQEEWNLELERGRNLERTRNLWLGSALAAGGAAFAYMLLSGGGDEPRGERRISVPLPGEWSVHLNPLSTGVALRGAF